MKLKPLHQLIKGTTFGQLSLVMLIVCVVSGVFLVVPYDVNNAYYSISLLMLTNPAASFFRNLHYWTAQFFLVFTLIHLYDHFTRRKKIKLGFSLWFRLTVGVIIIFLVMITGFILKGDADAQQAQRIFSELVGMVPFIGSMLQYTFVGDGESLQLIYVHHLATFTLFIVVIVMEHVRTVWPKLSTFLIFTGLIMGLSFLVMAPLHDGLNPVMKGPWYFVGFQELLHLLTHPGYALLLVLAILVLLLIVPYTAKAGWWPKRLLLIITVIYLLSTVVGYFFRGTDWQWIWPWRSTDLGEVYNPVDRANTKVLGFFSDTSQSPPHEVMGRNESCMQCHSEMTGFSSSHNPEAIGCYSCHGGNPFSPDKRSAHQGVRLIPGNLSDAQISCGTTQCHSDIASRIHSGLMATMSGVISVNRFVFNESETPDQLTSVHELQDSPADEHLRNMCVKCHLGNPKIVTGPVSESSRGGGCLACHLNYQDFDRGVAFYDPQLSKDTNYLTIHPSIDLKVSNDHCFGCHSRSGRISTNYEGWHETLLEATDISLQDTLYRLVEETRVFRFVQQDVHHKAGMDCIDCHNSYELMGDGNLYAHEEQQTEIACSDCHRDQANQVIKFADLDQESALIASLRYDNIGERVFLTTLKRNRALINTQVKNDSLFMHSKNSTKTFVLNPPHRACQRGVEHDEVSCSACHSAWAPSCIGCHNAYDEQELGYNMVLNKEKQGSWVEYVGEYNAHLPAMGIRKTETGQEVIPVVPGMVLTIDLASFTKDKHDSLIFKRLFAPAAPHTTASKGRSCTSCHNNPVALGYGKGKLDFIITNGQGKWRLISHYQDNKHDGLPEDAWVGFLDDRKGEVVSTRTDVFPFTVDQQKRILTVGACLTCHQDDSKIMEQSVINFDSLVSVRNKKCVLPTWPSGNFKP